MSTSNASVRAEPAYGEVVSGDGTPIGYCRSGAGPPLLLLHGTGADHTRWAPVLPALEEHFTVFAVDRRGRGRSGDAAAYALEREFEDVVAAVEGTAADVSVLGHSYGAGCALEAALLTRRIKRLVLYEPPLGLVAPPAETVGRLEQLLDTGERDRLLEVFMGEVAGATPEQIAQMRSLPAWRARLAVAHTIPRELRAAREYVFAPERFRDLTVPTLLLRGGDSPAVFGAAVDLAQAALPNSSVITMTGQGHVAMDTGTELFTREVLAFLRVPAA